MRPVLHSLRHRQTFLLVALVLAVQAALFHDTVADMTSLWTLSAYKHCWLVPPLSLWLVWRQGGNTEREPYRIGLLALLALPLLAGAWFVGVRAAIRALEHLSFVAIVVASIWAVLGWPRFRRILLPVALLFGAVPVGDFLIPTLMTVTADIAAGLLEVTGVPAWRQSEIITLPNGVFHVAEVCSGISYVLASLILSLIYTYLTFRAAWKRAAFVVFTVCAFVILNGIRAYIVMVVANATDMRWFTGWDHVYFGQFLFFCLAVVLFLAGERLSDREAGEVPPMPASPRSFSAATVGLGAVSAVLLSAGLASVVQAALPARTGAARMPNLVLTVVGCDDERDWQETFEPILPGAARASGTSYRCDDVDIGHFVAVFDDPVAGSELVNRNHRYWPDAWSSLGTRSDAHIESTTGPLTFGELALTQAGETRVVWFLYSVGNTVTADPYVAKLREALHTVGGHRAAGRLDIVTTTAKGDLADARARLAERLALERN